VEIVRVGDMQELDLFTLEWHGMVQFDTSGDKIYIDTARGRIHGSLVLAKNSDSTIALYISKEQISSIAQRAETREARFIKLDENW
jgi:hypothetical protein